MSFIILSPIVCGEIIVDCDVFEGSFRSAETKSAPVLLYLRHVNYRLIFAVELNYTVVQFVLQTCTAEHFQTA